MLLKGDPFSVNYCGNFTYGAGWTQEVKTQLNPGVMRGILPQHTFQAEGLRKLNPL